MTNFTSKEFLRQIVGSVVGRLIVSFITASGASIIGFMQELPWFYILVGVGLLFPVTMKGLLLLDDWQKHCAASFNDKERLKNLWQFYKNDPKNGRDAARLMVRETFENAEDIYNHFAPFDDDTKYDKRYPWAVGYAWASHLEIAKKYAKTYVILEEAEHSANLFDPTTHRQDSRDDRQKFYVEPLENCGRIPRW